MKLKITATLSALMLFAGLMLISCSPNEDKPATKKDKVPITPSSWLENVDRAPLNIHLTWQEDASKTITFQWRLEEDGLGADYVPKVWIVPSTKVAMKSSADFSPAGVSDPTDEVTLPMSDSYVHEGVCFTYQEGDATFVQCEVLAGDLAPGTEYYYRVGSWDDFNYSTLEFTGVNLSHAYKTKTALAKGSDEPFTFISAGDSREGAVEIVKNIGPIVAKDADFWIFNGDMNFSGIMSEWIEWWEAMEPITRDTVLMPVRGNHETIAANYFSQFALPDIPELADIEMEESAWSFVYGNAYIIGLDSVNTSLVEGLAPWFEAELKKASEDPDIDWIFTMFHYPPYSSGKHGSQLITRNAWSPLMEQYGVDICFNGHDHIYERTNPITDGEIDEENGVVYMVVGGFFAPGYEISAENSIGSLSAIAMRGHDGNYAAITVEGKTLAATVYHGDSSVLEQFEMSK